GQGPVDGPRRLLPPEAKLLIAAPAATSGPTRCRGPSSPPRRNAVQCALPFAAGAGAMPVRIHAALRSNDLFQRLSAVSAATDHRQADPAVVRRLGGGVDDLPGVLPDHPAARLRLLRRGVAAPVAEGASAAAPCAARAELRLAADRSGSAVETAWHRKSCAAYPRPAGGDGRPALFPAGDHQSAGAGVVRAQFSRAQPVPPVRLVQSGVDAGAPRLSVRARTLGAYALAVLRLVGGLCRIRLA